MSNGPKKKDDLLERTIEQEMNEELQNLRAEGGRGKTSSVRFGDHRRIRKVSPIGMRVLVSIRKDSNVSDGGLYLPEGAKAAASESVLAEVLEVATASDQGSDEESNISGIPLGAIVLIGKHAGVRVPWDDNLRLVETKEVLAIVHEMNLV